MMKENEQKDEKRETVADVVAIVRRAAQYYEGEAEKSEGLLRESFKLSAANYREIANLVEAAWKREKAEIEANALAVGGIVEAERKREREPVTERHAIGNAAAMREALVELTDNVMDYLHTGLIQLPLPLEEAIAKARAAISEPARNCDVGTAEEQVARHHAYCYRMMKQNNHCCGHLIK